MNNKNHKSLIKKIRLIALISILLGITQMMLVSCENEDDKSGTIMITTTLKGVWFNLYLAGNGSVTIDWGDGSNLVGGTLKALYDTDFLSSEFNVKSHTYTTEGTKTITISGNITGIYVGETNSVTAIDVSQMPGLKYLDCSNEKLSALDVTKNTILAKLDCENNKLSSLDISQNTAMKTLYCGSNNLSSIDVSHNTLLEALWCDNNALSSLDISKNTALVRLWCYNNNLPSAQIIGILLEFAKRTSDNNGEIYISGGKNEVGGTSEYLKAKDAAVAKGWRVS